MYKDFVKNKLKDNKHGFSLLELMVVIIIIAIGAAIAIPSMSGWFSKKDLDSIARQMFSDFQWARSEAISNSNRVQIQVHMDPDWYQVIYTSSGRVIVPQTDMPQGIEITNTTFPASAIANTTGISTRGFVTPGGSVTIHSDSAPVASSDRIITITLGGAVSIQP